MNISNSLWSFDETGSQLSDFEQYIDEELAIFVCHCDEFKQHRTWSNLESIDRLEKRNGINQRRYLITAGPT